jgi:hypothetical protein
VIHPWVILIAVLNPEFRAGVVSTAILLVIS